MDEPKLALNEIEIGVLRFSKKDLESLPKFDRELLLLFGHVANDLNVLNRFHLWLSHSVQQDGPLGKAGITQALVVGRTICGKLTEAWKVLGKSYFASSLARELEASLSEEAKLGLNVCKQYFSQTNRLSEARDELCFHYSVDQLGVGFDKAAAEDDWAFYIGHSRGNCLYYASEVVFGTALSHILEDSERNEGIELFLKDIVRVSNALHDFISGCLDALLLKHFGTPQVDLRSEIVSGVVPVSSVRIPFFVRPDDAPAT